MNRAARFAPIVMPLTLAAAAAVPPALATGLSLAGRGAPYLILEDARLAAAPSALGSLATAGTPRTLGAGDLDGDGMPDLAVGLEVGGRGRVVVYPGNVDHLFPNEPEAKLRRTSGAGFAEAFLPATAVVELERAPDFVAIGDVDADGNADIVAAARGASTLEIAAGDGRGGFGGARTLALGGALTAFAAGEIDQRDRLLDLAVAVTSGERSEIRIFAGPQGAANATAESLPLATPARALAFDELDADALPDLAAATADGIDLFFGVGRVPDATGADRGREVRRIEAEAVAIATGDFASDAGGYRRELAWVDADGGLVVALVDRDAEGRLVTRVASRLPSLGAGDAVRLVPAHLSSAGREQLVIVASGASPAIAQPEPPAAGSAAGRERLELDGAPAVAAVALRLNRDAFADLVLLVEGESEPVVMETAGSTTFTVTSAGNASDCNAGNGSCATDAGGGCGTGPCTLRAAIQEANALAGADTIEFAIGTGAQLLGTEAQAILESVTIDATTQPGYAGTPLITASYWAGGHAISCQGSGGYTVRGFGLTGPGGAIYLASGSTTPSFFEANHVGPLAAQPVPLSPAVQFAGGSANATLGGGAAAARNVLFGDLSMYAQVSGTDHVVEGNWIGLDAAGDFDSSNGHPIQLNDTSGIDFLDNVVAGAANSTFLRNALVISGGSGAVVQGNFVGTDSTGNADSGGLGHGLVVENGSTDASNLTLGGTAPGLGNVLAGNSLDGLRIGTSLTGIVVRGNRIGVGADGTTAVGNGGIGVRLGYGSATSILVGGTGAGEGNLVANNGATGVQVQDGWNHRIRGNSIFDNGGLAIDLTSQGNGTGVSPNDVGDGDGGEWSGHGNKYQNFPILSTAGGTAVTGGLNSTANQTFDLDFYSSPACDASGHGEAKVYLGSVQVTTNAVGNAAFNAVIASVANGAAVAATATDAGGNTSELSACRIADSTAIFHDDFETGLLLVWSAVVP